MEKRFSNIILDNCKTIDINTVQVQSLEGYIGFVPILNQFRETDVIGIAFIFKSDGVLKSHLKFEMPDRYAQRLLEKDLFPCIGFRYDAAGDVRDGKIFNAKIFSVGITTSRPPEQPENKPIRL